MVPPQPTSNYAVPQPEPQLNQQPVYTYGLFNPQTNSFYAFNFSQQSAFSGLSQEEILNLVYSSLANNLPSNSQSH